MYLTTEFLNLSGGASDSAFLHGQAKRQMTTEKQLPDAIFQLSCFEAVSIDIERNKGPFFFLYFFYFIFLFYK